MGNALRQLMWLELIKHRDLQTQHQIELAEKIKTARPVQLVSLPSFSEGDASYCRSSA